LRWLIGDDDQVPVRGENRGELVGVCPCRPGGVLISSGARRRYQDREGPTLALPSRRLPTSVMQGSVTRVTTGIYALLPAKRGASKEGEADWRTTVANTVAKPLDDVCHAPTTLEHQSRAPTRMDDPGRLAQDYGSEGHSNTRLRSARTLETWTVPAR
jgi:hypothetical protein